MQKTRRVLIAESDKQVQSLLENLVSELHNVECHKVSNGEEAIELMEKMQFELVLSATVMPDYSGVGLLCWRTDNQPEIPFVIFYNEDDQAVRDTIHSLKPTLVLPKPTDRDLVFQSVKPYLL